MIDLEQKIKLTYAPFLKKYLEPKGYKWEFNAFINVKLKDLPLNSNKYIEATCDYCKRKYKTKYQHYNYSRKNGGKDACENCKNIKSGENRKAYKNGIKRPVKITNDKRRVLRYTEDHVRDYLKEKGLILKSEFISPSHNIEFSCVKHPDSITSNTFKTMLQRNQGCRECYIESCRGEGSSNWKGGVTSITTYLRNNALEEWKEASKINSDYKCVITGENFDVIHHVYAFNLIVQEIFEELDLEIKQKASDYTIEELDLISNKCKELHHKYPLGVCLTNKVHNELHKIYGRGNNTPEQFEEFRKNYAKILN